MQKEFIILVKSLKHGKYCVAGREIERIGEGIRLLDNWIRPVNPKNKKGALSQADITYNDYNLPRFLDVIQIEVERNESDRIQSENWIQSPKRWQKLGKVELHTVLDKLVEEPENLWLGRGKSDRISSSEYFSRGYERSMFLVEAEDLEMRISTIWDHYENRFKKRRRAIFKYHGVEYNLSITDTDINKKYFYDFPGLGKPVRVIKPWAKRCLVAVSITPESKGYHYKIVGNIIEI